MGVSAAVAAFVAVGSATYASVDNTKHEETNASNAANVSTDNANTEIAAAQAQETQKLNAQANVTATAQARVRAIANPDGDTLMTSPLGQIGASTAKGQVPGQASSGQAPGNQVPNLNSPQPSPGQMQTPGKNTIGG